MAIPGRGYENKNHLKQSIPFNDVTPEKYKNRKKQEDYKIWGLTKFIPHTDLGFNSSTESLVIYTYKLKYTYNLVFYD